jgi:membrane protease YdiL (CAAX protease family)
VIAPQTSPAFMGTSVNGARTFGVFSQRILALAALVTLAFGAALFTQPTLSLRWAPAAVGCILAIFGILRAGPGSAIAIVAFICEALVALHLQWDIVMAAAAATWVLVSRFHDAMPPVALPRGNVPALPTFFCGAVTPVFLVGWVVLFKPNVSDIARLIPQLPTPLLVTGAVAFAIANALLEEGIWRGLFQSCMGELFSLPVAVAIQAVSFGAMHAHGFPRGIMGMVLAGTWGAMLGALRWKSRGLLAPVLAHVVADVTIALIMIFWLR